MFFSIIICTLGRTSELEHLLVSLTEQSFTDFEVQLIDQNDDDRLHLLLDNFKSKLNLTVWHHKERGLSAGRNMGIRNASGAFCAFPDDDCIYPPTLLEEAHNEITKEHLDCLALRVTDEKGNPSVGGNMEGNPMRVTTETIWGCVVTPGLFINRHKLLFVGGFDKNLGLGSAKGYHSSEDIALVLTLLSHHNIIHYKPNPCVIHPSHPWMSDGKRAKNHGLGMGKLLADANYSQSQVWSFALKHFSSALGSLLCFAPKEAKSHWNIGLGRLQGFYQERNKKL